MSKETLRLMLNLNPNDLDTQVALQCAPLLTGMKISNLLTVNRSRRAAVLELFRDTAVSCCILYESTEKTTFLLYIRQALEAYLARPEVKTLMERFGYRGWDLEEMLSLVSIKYEEHMEDRAGFPHEIGLLLGYPAKDVMGFIENNGKDFLYMGYWKVYADLPKCKRIFRAYSQARERMIHLVSRGMKIDGILRLHNLNQYKSMRI